MIINYKQILETFLTTIRIFSDHKYQERVWVNGIGPDTSSFEDAICNYFEYSESIISEYKLFGLTKLQLQTLQEFDKNLQSFCDTVPEIVDEKIEILPNPKWHKIQNAAKELLKIFNS